jgi:hypothetical protein
LPSRKSKTYASRALGCPPTKPPRVLGPRPGLSPFCLGGVRLMGEAASSGANGLLGAQRGRAYCQLGPRPLRLKRMFFFAHEALAGGRKKTRRPEDPSGAQVFQSPSSTRERRPLRSIGMRASPNFFGRGPPCVRVQRMKGLPVTLVTGAEIGSLAS